ncbi:RRM domain-containing protein [Caenorhabditis elegans]|nr:RRM domain-containing protein [Caenorhabditis elegans]CDK13508.1 RRM domain-containing protein [Caenorhabditis elegans]|eukprot:NP_001293781.1 HnRNP F homolog [Caenorhabditis elegans]
MSVDSGYDHGRRGGGGRYGDSSYDRGYDDYNRGSYGGRRDYGYNGGHDQGGRSDYGRGGDDPLRVYMRGLPYDADDHAIAAFFSPLRCHSVKIGINETGRPSGDAIAEFDNYNDLQVALSRNNQRMGRRYVELFDNRGAPGPMRRLLWKETSGTNASAAPAPDPILNGGRRGGGPPQRDSGYRAGPQAMPPSYRESRDPYGPREPRGYDIEPKYEPRGIPPRSAPIRAPPAAHGRAPDTWGSYGAASTGPSYDQSSAAGGYAASWDAYYASQAQSAYSAEPASTYPTAAHSAYGSGESYSYGASAGGAYDRQREPRDSQPTWAQQQQPSHHSAYGGWGAGAGDHRSGY